MNTIRIKHQDGDCIFEIKSVEMELSDGYLDIEITSRKNEDCPLGFFPPPSLYLENATIFCKSIDEIVDEFINIPIGWDTDGIEKENNIARIYIGEHQALDNTKIHLHRLSSKEIQISWVADAEDFNYYDERAKRNEIIVHTVYKYE